MPPPPGGLRRWHLNPSSTPSSLASAQCPSPPKRLPQRWPCSATALRWHRSRRSQDSTSTPPRARPTCLPAVHLFHPGAPLSFVHPLTASAVRTSMSPLHRGEAHRRAAAILGDQGAPDEAVAAHLLVAPPASDPSAVEVLRSAARKAIASGDAESAVRMLRRALAEQPPAEVYPGVLGELGEAELSAGLPQAGERIEAAIGATDDPARRGTAFAGARQGAVRRRPLPRRRRDARRAR